MDLLEHPEIKSQYDQCKYVVKLWEHNFKKSHGRLPSKLDIREADKKVRTAYHEYYYLKTAALEQSFKDVDGFHSDEENTETIGLSSTVPETINPELKETDDDVWGSHLNKTLPEPKEPKIDLNASGSKKLFGSSKLSKRYSRKSFSQKKTDSSFNSSSFCSQVSEFTEDALSQTFKESVTSDQDHHISFEGIFKKSNVKVVSASEKVAIQSTNIVQSVLENSYKSLKSVDQGWLERVGQSVGVEIEKPLSYDDFDETDIHLDYNSDDIIDNSDEECSVSLGPSAKRARLEKVETNETQLEKVEVNEIQPGLPEFTEPKPSNFTKEDVSSIDPFAFEENVTDKQTSSISVAESRKKNVTPKAKKTKETKTPNKNEDLSITIRSSIRSTRNLKAVIESDDEDPYHSDNDDKDPEFSLTKGKNKIDDIIASLDDTESPKTKTRRRKSANEVTASLDDTSIEQGTSTPKRKTLGKKNANSTKTRKKRNAKEAETYESEETDKPYELEYSVKPRVSAPRFKNLKKLIKREKASNDEELKEPEIKTKRQQEKEKLEKKIQSGSLNENFITINLKKKVFVRGKKNVNFSRYKKQQWKNKKKALAGPDMDMGGCDGGMLTCFNCGDIGHFARNCKNNKGDNLLPLGENEEPCPFPTLEEASKMAGDSNLAVRKSNMAHDKLESSDDDDIFNDGLSDLMVAEAEKIEEEVAKLDLHSYMDRTTVVESYYKTNEDGSVIDTPPEVFTALKNFGHSTFRPGQEQAVMRILSGKSTLVTLSTGSGKSLCYQLPAYLYTRREPCIALIISPLVSLMEDQVTGIPAFLQAACLHTNQTKTQRQKVLDSISSGLLNILLVSPEAVVAGEKQTGFGSLLRKLPPIAFACIDEAHCVSQWSHNFRPSYLMICRVLRERMGVKVVLGLTATATRSTSDSIIHHLEIPDGRNGIISDIPLPNNLVLSVSKDRERDHALLALLRSERLANCKSIIVYCTRRQECDRVTKFLRTSLQYEERVTEKNIKKRKRVNVQAEPYHAGLSASRRKSIQKAFMSGELRIVVATVAFGMGINKSDIRSVIHYNMPKSFESYVQEIGRAGRDGLPAHCHLFLDARGNDENELRRHIYGNSIDRHVIRKLLQKIFLPCSCKKTCPKHEVAFSIEQAVRALDIPEENISTLLCYLELHEKRYIELLSPAYTVCKVISYGGANEIRKAAKECPPLAMALALQKNKEEQNVVEFAVVDIAAAIGWDSGICKHKLKNLEWTAVNGLPKRSMLTVQFSNLGFRVLAPGNLDDDQLDEALDSLHDHVVNQEKTALLQLRAVHQTLVEVVAPSYKSCLTQELGESSEKLKVKIREYFESPNPLEGIKLTENNLVDEELVVNNIRALISTYRDNNFTGRAIARIFHGVMSPNYPAVIWGRCKFWRCHLNVDFNTICRLATKEILNFK